MQLQTEETELSLYKLMRFVEDISAYKIHWLLTKNQTWTHFPKVNPQVNEILEKANNVSKPMTKKTLNGIMIGKSIRTFKPPANATGTLITWLTGGKQHAVQACEHDGHLE